MVDMDEALRKKVKIMMSNTVVDKSGSMYRYADVSAVLHGGEVSVEGVTDEPDEWLLNNNQAEMLVKLYQQLSSAEQKDLLDQMKHYLASDYNKELIKTAVLVFVHTNNIDMLTEIIISDFKSYNHHGYLYVVVALVGSIMHKPNLFSDAQLERLYDWVGDYYAGKNELGDGRRNYSSLYSEITVAMDVLHNKCNILLTRSFSRQIESAFNPELNQDEQKVIESIEQIGFPLDLVESLRHINELVQNANKPMNYRDCMSAIRVFTERLYERIAKELEPETRVDGKDSEAAAKLFKKHKLISTDMAETIVAVRHFLSNDGTHRLKSRREDARIAKNMAIEISLYLITRLRELQADKKQD